MTRSDADQVLPMKEEDEAGKPGNLGASHNQEQEHKETQHEPKEEQQDPPLPVSTTTGANLPHKVPTASAMLAAEKRNIAYPKKRAPATDTNEEQPIHKEKETVESTRTGEVSALLAHEKRHIAYPKSGPSGGATGSNQGYRPDQSNGDSNHQIATVPPPQGIFASETSQPPPSGACPRVDNSGEVPDEFAETENTQPPTFNPVDSNTGLAVANLVENETTAQDLPQAQDYSPDENNTNREERMTRFKTKVLFGVIIVLLLAIAIMLVVIFASGNKTVETVMPSPSPTSIPTAAPTSYSEYWLSLFPEATVSAILEEPASPQSRAFEWLVEEMDVLHNLTDQRVVQRFVLATFYFANSEEQWLFSNNWLNHSVHECLWYSSLEDWYFFSEANIYIPLDHITPCEQYPAGYLEDGILYQGDGILKHFWLSFNGVHHPRRALWPFKFGVSFDVGMWAFGSIPEALGSLSKLGVIHFFYNSLTGTIPSSLFSLTNSMQAITLVGNQLTGPIPTELGLLTTLVGLAVEANLFTGTIPTELGRLTGLRSLFLAGLNLNGALPNELAVLTDMELLQLHNSGLTGTLPKWLGNMTSLEGLTLSDNSLTGTIPTELGLLTKLWNLWLGGNALSGGIPSEIGKCEQMIFLVLERCGLTATIPTELGLLSELLQLWLFDNDLTGTVPLELGNVPFPAPYGQVWLDRNDLSGIIPESLCSANDLLFDCSSQLCGCDLCNCSDNRTSPILDANQTEGNQTEP
ncbi:LRR receptor-like serine threonine-protein kinase [Seminavis robusta]|uniref:LRR receptor-like serine threonine-protein kinase n=1 Tax=Seminavis robusta TaxID=568900 RepID=A0A9N8HKI3_9STRA|nr:LRR receptor-like serine threonine-protein kinase [Seminavis robusta]|eukprot:Sro946_g223210.1 LRR receptor-like serine threonine-protein kinase (750) ;mRNA; r:1970-4764